MKSTAKKIISLVSIAGVLGMGYEVATHEAAIRFRPTVEKIKHLELTHSAQAQNFDRGFADLVKRVSPGVVNISTYSRPRTQPGYPGGGYPGQGQYGGGGGQGMYQGDPFQRFFEDFFGGRVPRGGMRPQAPSAPGDENDDEGGPQGAPQSGSKVVPIALGTGFVIDAAEGLILTNNHVIQGAEEVKVQFKEEEADLISAKVVGRDPELDVALLKVKIKTKLTSIPLGDSDAIDVGEYVLALGNPLGYGHSVSHGILSAKGRRNPEFRVGRYLQTDASINPGNSGGPLVNVRGEVIGINNAIDARAHGIGFAIPINLVKGVLSQLKTKGTVARGFLGVSAADLSSDLAQQLHLDPKLQGVVVADVSPGAPADRAGIRPYDVITSVNGEKITNSQDLTMKITSIPIGQSAKVNLLRSGKAQELNVKVTERPVDGITQASRRGRNAPPAGPGADLAAFGFRALEVTPQNSQNYGFPPGLIEQKTVVVSSVEPGGPAENSGLNQGDIILDVSGKAVHSIAELEKAFKTLRTSAMVRVKRFDSAGNDFVAVVVLNK